MFTRLSSFNYQGIALKRPREQKISLFHLFIYSILNVIYVFLATEVGSLPPLGSVMVRENGGCPDTLVLKSVPLSVVPVSSCQNWYWPRIREKQLLGPVDGDMSTEPRFVSRISFAIALEVCSVVDK